MTNTIDEKILIFLKAPVKGSVKTRLAESLGDDATLLLYKAFVWDIVDKASKTCEPLIFAYPEDKLSMVSDFLGYNLKILPQKGFDLGEKMAEAFSAVFKSGVKRAVLIGTDIPDIDDKVLLKALERLKDYDCVFGPSKDGGYYLAGFSTESFDPCFFEGIRWSTESVLRDTILKVKGNRKSVYFLKTLNDIDNLTDLEELIKSGRDTGTETRKAIETLIEKRVIK